MILTHYVSLIIVSWIGYFFIFFMFLNGQIVNAFHRKKVTRKKCLFINTQTNYTKYVNLTILRWRKSLDAGFTQYWKMSGSANFQHISFVISYTEMPYYLLIVYKTVWQVEIIEVYPTLRYNTLSEMYLWNFLFLDLPASIRETYFLMRVSLPNSNLS